MNQKKLNWGIAITGIWLTVIIIIWFFAGLKSPSSLNEFGDALAGIFAPIAFFWLILGYVQQGKQLDQNTKALEQQERALQLQIDEMKESVKQQKELALIQNKHFDALNNAVKPILIIKDAIFQYLSKGGYCFESDGFMIQVKFKLMNLGGAANKLYIRNSRQQAIYFLDQLDIKGEVLVEIDLYELDLDVNDTQQTMIAEITLDFENVHAEHMILNFEVYMQTELEDSDRKEECYIYQRV